jgi:hypothetical protein
VSVNPLVAGRLGQPKSAWAGVWIAEDIELIAQGVRGHSWVDGSLGVVGAGLDALALVSDPVGALLQYGISWLIEHVRPLSEALDWLAGDPGQIAGHALTWRNVASSLRDESDVLARAARFDVSGWRGAAADAYRVWAGQRDESLQALARASDTMALITEGAGMVIGTVRIMVRDAVATVVSRLMVYAGELVASFGLATPLVVEQVSTLCASWAARISRWLRDLIASIRNLMRESARLGELIETIKRWLKGDGHAGRGPEPETPLPPKDPRLEEQRIHDLGMDPATKRFRLGEADTAVRIEQERGVILTRAPDGHSADWLDEAGKSYDAVGNFPPQFFDRQWPRFSEQIELHLQKADYVPVDVSTFTTEQVARIEQFIAEKGLAPRVFILGR